MQKKTNPKVVKIKSGKIMLLSKWAMCDTKKSKFIKEQEASRLSSGLRIKTPRIPLVSPLLF